MTANPSTSARPTATTVGFGWRKLLTIATAVTGIAEIAHAFVTVMPAFGIVYGLLLLAAAWRLSRSSSRLPVLAAGSLHALELVMMFAAYGAIESLGNPAAWQDFLFAVFFTVALATGTVAAVGALRES